MRCGAWWVAGLLGWWAASAGAAPLRWEFDQIAELSAVNNLAAAPLTAGRLGGLTQWDPYVYLALPPGGVAAETYRTLRLRLYSSAPADLLDLYYKTAAGAWCLGGRLPVQAGWAVYTVDLPTNGWRESPQADWKRWGGPDGQVVSFRIDPGNEAGRWVMFDWAELSAEPAATGVEAPAARPVIDGLRAEVPPQVAAGAPVEVTLRLNGVRNPNGGPLTAYARLQSGQTLLGLAEVEVPAVAGPQTLSLPIPTRPFLAAELEVRAGIYEALGGDETADDLVGHVTVTAARAAAVDFPRCEVRPLGGSPAMFVDGEPTPLFSFASHGALTDLRPRTWHQEMAAEGITQFADWFGTSGSGDLGHLAPDVYDYTGYDNYFATRLQQVPEATFLPHLYVTAPRWWQQAHPEELVVHEDGQTGIQSFASERWKREIGDDLARLVAHLRAAPYADRILGLVICSGHSAEWQSWGLWSDRFTDYSAPGRAAWQRWLTDHGRDPATPVPTPESRTSSSHGLLRDPVAERGVIDYLTFLNELDADAILYFCGVVKAASDRRLLCATYYGYQTQHHYHQAESGHNALAKVLDSPDLDLLMSPPLYTERGIGGVTGFMSVIDSVHRHGKLWYSEADYRTSETPAGAGFGQTETPADSLAVLWREMALLLTKRAAVSWYDMTGGWLSGPDLPPALGAMRRLMADYLPRRRPFHSEVAVFIDPASSYYVKPQLDPARFLTLQPVVQLSRAGAPFDLYLLSDLPRADLPDYRLYVFLNAYALDAPMRAAIGERLARPGVSALWHWAAGYTTPTALAGPAAMAELTGLPLRQLDGLRQVALAPGEVEAYRAALAGTAAANNPAVALDPLFVPATGEILARLEPGGEPALARARRGDGWATYSALPVLPAAVLRQIYRDAGVRVYLDSDDAWVSDNGFAAVHTATGGSKSIWLPAAGRPLPSAPGLTPLAAGENRVTLPEHITALYALEGGE